MTSYLKTYFSHRNYTKELMSSMNEMKKLWFERENFLNWIETRLQQKHSMI